MSQNETPHATGPVTESGKFIVSQNALKHGLTATTHAALPGEEAQLAKYVEGYQASYSPVGMVEEDLVRALAEHNWRLKRAHAMERALFTLTQNEAEPNDSPDATLANAWINPRKGLQRIALYAARIQRAIEKATRELNSLQAARKAAHAKAQEEALLLTQLAESEGNTWDPAEYFDNSAQPGGFVYSRAAIDKILTHQKRLETARTRLNPPSSRR